MDTPSQPGQATAMPLQPAERAPFHFNPDILTRLPELRKERAEREERERRQAAEKEPECQS